MDQSFGNFEEAKVYHLRQAILKDLSELLVGLPPSEFAAQSASVATSVDVTPSDFPPTRTRKVLTYKSKTGEVIDIKSLKAESSNQMKMDSVESTNILSDPQIPPPATIPRKGLTYKSKTGDIIDIKSLKSDALKVTHKFCQVQFKYTFRYYEVPATLANICISEFVVVQSFEDESQKDMGLTTCVYTAEAFDAMITTLAAEKDPDKVEVGRLLRRASPEETMLLQENRKLENKSLKAMKKFLTQVKLPMIVLGCEFQNDNRLFFVYYKAEVPWVDSSFMKCVHNILKQQYKDINIRIEMKKVKDAREIVPLSLPKEALWSRQWIVPLSADRESKTGPETIDLKSWKSETLPSSVSGRRFCQVQFKFAFRYYELPDTLLDILISEFVIVQSFEDESQEDLGVTTCIYSAEEFDFLIATLAPEKDPDELRVGLLLRRASPEETMLLREKSRLERKCLKTLEKFRGLPLTVHGCEFQIDQKVFFVYYLAEKWLDLTIFMKYVREMLRQKQMNICIVLKRVKNVQDFVPLPFARDALKCGKWQAPTTLEHGLLSA